MAMNIFNPTPVQRDAARQIYRGFYDHAIKRGADHATAMQFAHIGLGVASGEGLRKDSPWTANPDNGVTSVGPFQLNINGGVGSNYGLGRNASPGQQILAAADTMWNGNSEFYNTQPWNTVGDTTGRGRGKDNDTYVGQDRAEQIGAQLAQRMGLSPGTYVPDNRSQIGWAGPDPRAMGAGPRQVSPYGATIPSTSSGGGGDFGAAQIAANQQSSPLAYLNGVSGMVAGAVAAPYASADAIYGQTGGAGAPQLIQPPYGTPQYGVA
jgi:hypothetical protein